LGCIAIKKKVDAELISIVVVEANYCPPSGRVVVVLRTSIDHMGYTCCIWSKAKWQ